MAVRFIPWSVVIAAILFAVRMSPAQQPVPPALPAHGLGFPSVAVAPGESARINALNRVIGPAPQGPEGCRIALRFYDAQGQLLKELAVPRLAAGQSASLDLNRDDLPGRDRVSLRAVVAFGYEGGANPPAQLLRQIATCNIVASLEIYANDSKTVRAVVTDPRPLPGPSEPAQ